MEKHFDVVILGGGPAGTAAGMTLLKRAGTSVAIIEKSNYETHRPGESLTPGVRPLLEYLDLWQAFQKEQSLNAFGSEAAWGSSEAHALDYLFTLHGTGWCLDRVRFDRMMAMEFERRGGQLKCATQLQNFEQTDNKTWRLQTINRAGKPQEFSCDYLIDASGRTGVLAKQLKSIRKQYDRLVGIGAFGVLQENMHIPSSILVEACSYGWWYSAPVPGQKVVFMLMSDADIVGQQQLAQKKYWQELLEEMPLTRERFKKIQFSNVPMAFSAKSSCLETVGGSNWVAVGDAVASHDPLSSSGIPHAIGSGVHGALVAADALFASGKMLTTYQESIHKDFQQYLNTHWQYYQREKRWTNAKFWKRRQTRVTLSPNAKLKYIYTEKEKHLNVATHLPKKMYIDLLRSCKNEMAVYQVVRHFLNQNPQVSDQQAILGLQELVEEGYVSLA